MMNVPVQKFKEFFGADAVLYVTIEQWDTKYFLTAGSVTVKAACELKSTATGDVLWFYDDAVEVNTSGESGGATGLAGLLAKVVTTAIKTATQSYIPLAREASAKIFLAMPSGKYSKQYNQDQKVKIEKKKAQTKDQQEKKTR
jgi:hypothetical protein